MYGLTVWRLILTGIDTGKALVEEMRKEMDRKGERQAFLLEPMLALTGSLSLTQGEIVPGSLQKCDIPGQLHLSGKLGVQEAIL